MPWGMFGENFTTEGLFEGDLHIGDRLRIGSAVIVVRQPRIPCYKLAVKFRRKDILARFLRSGRSGFYFSVEQEGTVEAGESFEFWAGSRKRIAIAEMNHLFVDDSTIANCLTGPSQLRRCQRTGGITSERDYASPVDLAVEKCHCRSFELAASCNRPNGQSRLTNAANSNFYPVMPYNSA